jgi:hypothetical protein
MLKIQEGKEDLRGCILILNKRWQDELIEAPVQVFDLLKILDQNYMESHIFDGLLPFFFPHSYSNILLKIAYASYSS